jgi:hypothetical protein
MRRTPQQHPCDPDVPLHKQAQPAVYLISAARAKAPPRARCRGAPYPLAAADTAALELLAPGLALVGCSARAAPGLTAAPVLPVAPPGKAPAPPE